MSSSGSYDSDYDDYEESEQEDEGSPENHFKILPTAVPLNFAVIMNPERIRAIRITDTRCALVRGKKNVSMLVKVIPSASCPVDCVLVPKLLQFSLDVARDDSLCILPFDGKMQADAIQIVPLFDPGHTDYTSVLTEYFSTDYHPVSVGSAFAIYVAGNVLNFRVLNILPTDRCIAWKKTRIVVINPQRAPPNATLLGRHFSDLAVTADVLNQVSKFIQLPVQHPALLKSLGLKTSNGVLIYGGKGAGKSSLLLAISRETKVPFLFVKIPDLMNLDPEQAMAKLHESFAYVLDQSPALLLLDDIQAITRGLKNHKHVKERRLASTFVSLLDRCLADQGVVVVATASHHDDVDSSLHRLGRFAFEISLSDPLPAQRAEIITLNTVGVNIEAKDIVKLSGKTTDKRTCAEVANITEVAVNRMIRRYCPNPEKRFVPDNEIFKAAQNTVEITDFPVEIANDEAAEDFSLFGDKTESPKSDDNLFSGKKAKGDIFSTSPKSPRGAQTSPRSGSSDGSLFDTPTKVNSTGGLAPSPVSHNTSNDFFPSPAAKAQEAPIDPFGASASVPVSSNPFATQPPKPLQPTSNPFASEKPAGKDSQIDPFGVQKNEPEPQKPAIDPFAKPSAQKSDLDIFGAMKSPQQTAQPAADVDPFASMANKPAQPASDPFASMGASQPAQQASDPFASMGAGQPAQSASNPFTSMGSAQPVSDPFAQMGANQAPPASDPFASGAGNQPAAGNPFLPKAEEPPKAASATDVFRMTANEPAQPEKQQVDPFANAPQQKPVEDPFATGAASATSVFSNAPTTNPFAAASENKPEQPVQDPFAQSAGQLPTGFGVQEQPANKTDPFANAPMSQMQFGQTGPPQQAFGSPFGFASGGGYGDTVLGGGGLRDMFAQGPLTQQANLAGPPGGEMPEDAFTPNLTPEQKESRPGNKGDESAMLAIMGISSAPKKAQEPEQPQQQPQQDMGFGGPQQSQQPQQQDMGFGGPQQSQQQQQMGFGGPQQQQMGFGGSQQNMGFGQQSQNMGFGNPQQQQMGLGQQYGNQMQGQYGMGQQGFGQQMGGFQGGNSNPFGNPDPFNQQPMQGFGYGGNQFGQSGGMDPFAQAGFGYQGADPFAQASMRQANYGFQQKGPEPDIFADYDPVNKKK